MQPTGTAPVDELIPGDIIHHPYDVTYVYVRSISLNYKSVDLILADRDRTIVLNCPYTSFFMRYLPDPVDTPRETSHTTSTGGNSE